MDKKFLEGETTGLGIKSFGEEVSKEMRYIRDDSGKRIFCFDEYFRPQQITSYFSRMADKRRKVTIPDIEPQTSQDNHKRLCNDVVETFKQKTLKHSVIFLIRNLCLTKEDEFKEFKMTQPQRRNIQRVHLRRNL